MHAWAKLGVRVQACVTSPPYFGLRDYQAPGQLGMEETVDEYVAALVDTFRAVRDLLTDDGTLWLNLGDSYVRDGGNGGGFGKTSMAHAKHRGARTRRDYGDLKPKDLIGVPWMVAFALRADGWYLRRDNIWHKPNPKPESVTDRCTTAHEYVFHLSKSESYFYDHQAMQEEAVGADRVGSARGPGNWGHHSIGMPGERQNRGYAAGLATGRKTRNRRSVWSISTKPFRGAHSAVFPPELAELCVLAGTRPGDTVLDPFMGSGTVAGVAQRHGRRYLGCEINAAYAQLHPQRIAALGRAE